MSVHGDNFDLRGFDKSSTARVRRLSSLYKKSLECIARNCVNADLNMERKFRKCFDDNMATLKGITADNDSGYMSQNIESNSSVDTSLDRQIPIAALETDVKEIFLNEDALLEKPILYSKHYEQMGDQFEEHSHSYSLPEFSDQHIVNASVSSRNTTFSGFEDNCGVLDYSVSIPVATPITVEVSTSEAFSESSKKNVPEKENDMNSLNVTNKLKVNLEQEKKLYIEETDLSSIQTRMMDANNDMSLFESFYSFVCKLYTKNEPIAEDTTVNSINPSQLHICQSKKLENSPYKTSYLDLESNSGQRDTTKNVEVSKGTFTPAKIQIQNNTATSPELFSDEEVEENSANKSESQKIKHGTYIDENDRALLKKLRDSLSGVPPPPNITISLLTVNEILEKVKENKGLFMTNEDVNDKNVNNENRKTLLVNCTKRDVATAESFSDVLNLRYHGLHHNRSKVSEEFEHLCIQYTERYVGAETQSSCTTFGVNTVSPSKRKIKYKKMVKSPGKRLSHLARRRITFSKDSLQSNMNTSCSFIGSRTRQIMVDARKYELLSRRKSPKKKSPRKTPSKSPRRKGNTPKSSGKKKYLTQFNPHAIEESLDTLSSLSNSSSKPSSTKRALFQSPPNKDSNCSNSLLSVFNSDSNSSCSQHSTSRTSRRALFTSPKRISPTKMTISSLYPARRKMTPKRALFKSPDKQSASELNEVCDKKRKRTDLDDGHPSKISRNVSGDSADLDSSNETKSETAPRSSSWNAQDITQHRKKKLMWTVAEALRSQNVDLKHPQFKVYASVLARVIRHFLPNLFTNGPRPEGSTTESMLRIARQYVFAVTRGKTVDQIIREAQKNKSRIRRPSGYVGLDKVSESVDSFRVRNKENILQDRVNIIGSVTSDKTLYKNRRSENVERIRRVINFGDDNDISNTGIS